MKIVFRAYNPKNTEQATAGENIEKALSDYLDKFESKEVCVIEYRNGVFKATIGGVGENYCNLKLTRQQAQAKIMRN